MKTREETDTHFTRRLESFSDIVFGFSLSLVGLQLVVPERPIMVLTNPVPLIGYAVSFGLIAIYWQYHHRYFVYSFFPDTLNVVLNFVKLGLVELLPFSLQLYLHFPIDPLALCIYFLDSGAIIAISAIGMYRGLVHFWPTFDEPFRREQWLRVVRVAIIAGVLCAGAFAALVGFVPMTLVLLSMPVLLGLVRGYVRWFPDLGRVLAQR